jgi:hypothetical protein
MLTTIRARFDDNLGRVRNLVKLYDSGLVGSGQGRRPVHSADVLRAATVLLHATLEELLRGLSRWKLPEASKDALNEIPLVGFSRPDKFHLGELSAHRGKSVDDLIAESLDRHLERSSYNNVEDIVHLLYSIGVDDTNVKHLYPRLAELMARRHLIVHRADKEERHGRGHHRAKSIGKRALTNWVDTVLEFAAKICNELER